MRAELADRGAVLRQLREWIEPLGRWTDLDELPAERFRNLRAQVWWKMREDLADGDFSEETWRRILMDILGYELVPPVESRGPEPPRAKAAKEPA